MKAPARKLSPTHDTLPGVETSWFIFTTHGRGSCLEAPSLTKAVAKWKKLNRGAKIGEIAAVIQGAGQMQTHRGILNTPVFGVVVCLQSASPRGE